MDILKKKQSKEDLVALLLLQVSMIKRCLPLLHVCMCVLYTGKGIRWLNGSNSLKLVPNRDMLSSDKIQASTKPRFQYLFIQRESNRLSLLPDLTCQLRPREEQPPANSLPLHLCPSYHHLLPMRLWLSICLLWSREITMR